MPERAGTPVFLRNGQAATVTGSCEIGEFRLQGFRHTGGLDSYDLWTATGHWSDCNPEHPFDITKLVTASGEVIAAKGIIA